MVNMVKYKTYKIESTPSEKFPEMVTVIKGKSVNKKFINEYKAKVWIEAIIAENLINRGSKKVKGELSSIGLIPEPDTAW